MDRITEKTCNHVCMLVTPMPTFCLLQPGHSGAHDPVRMQDIALEDGTFKTIPIMFPVPGDKYLRALSGVTISTDYGPIQAVPA